MATGGSDQLKPEYNEFKTGTPHIRTYKSCFGLHWTKIL